MAQKLPLLQRVALFVRDRGTCIYCGASYQDGAQLTVDHVQSRKRGGSDGFENLVTACRPCNEDKAHFSLRAYLVELQDRGVSPADCNALAARVTAATSAPIDWSAVEAALILYRQQGKAPLEDDD
jgi:5-methylcytosine-specific restriction endonuclease McrA